MESALFARLIRWIMAGTGLPGLVFACQRPLWGRRPELPHFTDIALASGPRLVGRPFKADRIDTLSWGWGYHRINYLYYPHPKRSVRYSDTLARDREGHSHHECYQVTFTVDADGRARHVRADLSDHRSLHTAHPILLNRRLKRLARGYVRRHRFLPAQMRDSTRQLYPVATRGAIEVRFYFWKPANRRLRPVEKPAYYRKHAGLWFYPWKPRERFRRASRRDTLVYDWYSTYRH